MTYDPYSILQIQQPTRVFRSLATNRSQTREHNSADGWQSVLEDALRAGNKGQETTAPSFEEAIRGNMNPVNSRALSTLSRVLSDTSSPVAADPFLQSGLASLHAAIADATALSRREGARQGGPLKQTQALRAYTAQKTSTPMPAAKSSDANLAEKNSGIPADTPPSVQTQTGAQQGLGWLAARFESGKKGLASIGYDRHGGTSYGTYQISSRAGSMDAFIKYLHKAAPAYAKRLEAAGPANTGSRGGAMPQEWKKIAAEDPKGFEALQTKFVRRNNFLPALRKLMRSSNLEQEHVTGALGEVLWSTAIQHGPTGAARIFRRALGKIDSNMPFTNPEFQENLIRAVYNLRGYQFGSSTTAVQSAVQNRLGQEMELALSLIGDSNSALA